MSYHFNAEQTTAQAVQWIRDWFEKNGKGCNAVLGISGGKDSSIAAALCVEALGKERVIGVLMPNGEQSDIDCSYQLVKHLGIEHYLVNIKDAFDGVLNNFPEGLPVSEQTRVNLAPRIRMTTLYAISQSRNGRVVNTCNGSENYVGYSTRFGDDAGDFSPLGKLTVEEVLEIGFLLDLPENLVKKVPSDGLCGKTDEDNLGFTYAALDKYIRTGVCENAAYKERIDKLHKQNLFKLETIATFEP
jgi:NAD+ synthase